MSSNKKLGQSNEVGSSQAIKFTENDYGSFQAELNFSSRLDGCFSAKCEYDENWEAKLDDMIEAFEILKKAGNRYFSKMQSSNCR